MNILHVYKDYYPPVKGGIENHINLLANGLKAEGVDVQVLVSNTKNQSQNEQVNGIKVTKAPQLGRFYSAPITPTFHCYLRRLGKDADILHFHHPNPTADFSYLFTNLNKKLVVTYHSDIIRQDKLGMLYSPFRTIFLNKADKIIATSPNYVKTSKVLQQFAHKCTVIPLGVDIERFTSNNELSKVGAIRKVYNDQPIILFVGCFRYYKGLHLLVSAMESVPATLILVGAGPEEAKLRNLVKQKQLYGKVHFLGELSDDEVNAYYKASDIFVLPSHLRSEAFGIVQLEAMCCKKPVISTELGTGTTFVNVHQETGITIQPDDIDALSNAMRYLIDHPEKRAHFGENGFNRVVEQFSAEKMLDRTLRLYESLCNKQPKFNQSRQNDLADENQKKIKILRIISRMNIGGPSIHVKNLTEGLNPSTYETKLITGSVSPEEGDMSYIARFGENVRITIPELQREIRPLRDLNAFFKVIRVMLCFKPDIVHSHTSKAGAIARLAVACCSSLTGHRPTTVHTFHGHVLDGYFGPFKAELFKRFEQLMAKLTDRVITLSESQKWELSTVYRLASPKKIETIKLGFDLSAFTTCSRQKGILRKRLGLSEDTFLIGIVGRLAPIKNHRMFLDAGKLLLDGVEDRNIRLVIVGDGEERAELEAYAKQIDIDKITVFHGWEKDIPMIYADIDILALTSLNEGTPVSVIEALAASVPVVTTGVGGIKDLLGEYESTQPEPAFKICQRGILCPKGDAYVFSKALKYMIDSGYLTKQNRFTRAKNFVLKNYSIDRLIYDIESLYDDLMQSNTT